MSIDHSLTRDAPPARPRTVRGGAGRVAHTKVLGFGTDDMNVLGLPKVGNRKAALGKKSKVDKTTDAEGQGDDKKEDEQKSE